jgi:hypothetical protein
MVISVATPQVDDVLPTAEAARMPSEACAPLAEGIVNVKTIDPAYGAGRNHPRPGASVFGSDDA